MWKNVHILDHDVSTLKLTFHEGNQKGGQLCMAELTACKRPPVFYYLNLLDFHLAI